MGLGSFSSPKNNSPASAGVQWRNEIRFHEMKLISLLLVDLCQQGDAASQGYSCSLFVSWPQLLPCCGLNQRMYLPMPDRTGWGCQSQPALSHPPGLQFLGQVWL